MTPEQYLLASAYLDGELTDEERRLAVADPAVMAEVEEFRALHIDLASIEPPTAAARESAIAAAMAAFPATSTAASTATSSDMAPVVPFKPRPTYAKYLSIAAAVVAVGLLGTVIVNTRGGNDEASSSFDSAEAQVTERAMVESTEAPAADAPASDAADNAADMAVAEAPLDDDASPAMTGAPADAPAEESPAEPADGGTADAEMASTDPSLPGDDTLIVLAEDILFRRDAGVLPPTPNTSCTVADTPNAFILERADVPTVLGSVDLFLAIDETTRMVYGLDPETCETLVDAALP